MPHALPIVVSLLLALLNLSQVWAADEQPATGEPLAKAQDLFATFQKQERAFDPKTAELYDDKAVIRMRRIYPNGAKRDVEINGQQLKELLPQAMPLAKQRGDTNEYRKLKYTTEGDGVRISGERYSNLKKTTNAWSLLLKPNADGRWLIYEETTESQAMGN